MNKKLVGILGMLGIVMLLGVFTFVNGSGRATANNAPVVDAVDDFANGVIGQPISFDVCANDSLGSGLESVVKKNNNQYLPNGVVLNGCILEGTPTECEAGTLNDTGVYDSTYHIVDTDGNTDIALIFLTVACEDSSNLIPSAGDDNYTAAVGDAFSQYICDNDTEGDGYLSNSMVIKSGGIAGLTLANCMLTGTIEQCGVQTLTYEFTDVDGDAASAVVTIDVPCDPNPTPDPNNLVPTAGDDNYTAAVGDAFSQYVCNNDTEGDGYLSNSMVITSGGVAGLTLANCMLTGTIEQCGVQTLTYEFTDVDGDAASAVVTIDVPCDPNPTPDPSNGVPTAGDDNFTGEVGVPLTVDVCGNDTEGPDYYLADSMSIIDAGTGYTLSNCTLTGTPTQCGVQMFDYSFTDQDGDVAQATITITVPCAPEPTPEPPAPTPEPPAPTPEPPAPTPEPEVCNVSEIRLRLINAATNKRAVGHISDGAVFSADLLNSYSIQAAIYGTNESKESVEFHYTTPNGSGDRIDNVAPYSLFGDSRGNYSGKAFVAGTYTIKATTYTKDNAGGVACFTEEITFTVEEAPAPTPEPPAPTPEPPAPTPEPPAPTPEPEVCNVSQIQLRLINAATNKRVVANISDGAVFSADLLNSYSVQAAIYGTKESVELHYTTPNGSGDRIENVAPFALFGDSNGNYNGEAFVAGTYTIKAIAYTEDNARGLACFTKEITFTVEPAPEPVVVTDPPSQCEAETGGLPIAGFEVFENRDGDFADKYLLFDRNGNLITTVFSNDFSNRTVDRDGLIELEWESGDYGFSSRDVYSASAMNHGEEASEPVTCVRNNVSPIALDLDGSGAIELIDGAYAIDITGDGNAETISQWFGPNDGILVDMLSKVDGNVGGAALFGDEGGKYIDGFEKLATLDANGDGEISGGELDNLALWIDANGDAQAEPSEKHSLADFGIVSISTSHVDFVSSATLADGSSMHVEDVWFNIAE